MSNVLSPEAVAQMVADREAGTPGPWRMRVNKRDAQDTCDVSICGDIFVLADLNGPQYAHQHANARRIARLPDLESAYLTLAAENATLRASEAAALAHVKRLEAALLDAGAMRDAADRVSQWFCTDARQFEGPRIQGLRMAIVAYDRHMQPNPSLTPTADKE